MVSFLNPSNCSVLCVKNPHQNLKSKKKEVKCFPSKVFPTMGSMYTRGSGIFNNRLDPPARIPVYRMIKGTRITLNMALFIVKAAVRTELQ